MLYKRRKSSKIMQATVCCKSMQLLPLNQLSAKLISNVRVCVCSVYVCICVCVQYLLFILKSAEYIIFST